MGEDSTSLLQDLQTIMAVSRALGSERNLDRLLDRILAACSELVDAERASLFLVDADRNELWTRIAQGDGVGHITLPMGKGIAGTVAATGTAVNIPAAYADPRFNPEHDQLTGYVTRSILCMPLTSHTDQVVGVIQVLNKRDGQPFCAYDEQLLSALCSQAGVALDNAQLILRDRDRQRMEREMELARQIQLSLLPQSHPQVVGWRFASFSQSCDETGGDYYDFLTRSRGSVDLVVGDVSGHGIGSALLMSSARASLRALHRGTDAPSDLMGGLNRLLTGDMGDDAFMSMILTRLDDLGGGSWVSAGHEAPLVLRADGTWATVPGDGGLLLGLMQDWEYVANNLPRLHPGDCLVLMTDGIFEAQRPDRPCLGLEAIAQGMVSAAGQGAEAVCAAVVARVRAHLDGHAPHDDMTLLVAERTA